MTKLQIINLTPHNINLCDETGVLIEQFPPSGNVARVAELRGELLTHSVYDGIPVRAASSFGAVMVGTETLADFVEAWENAGRGLNDPKPLLIVSSIVASAVATSYGGRAYVISPDTSAQGAVRNDQGQIVGVKGFVRSF